MSIQKVEMTVEQKENGQYVEQVVYPFVEYDHVAMENGMDIMSMIRDDVSTPMVTHNTTSWKVGKGDSDVNESIVDSSVANMTIKGQTYQNILPTPSLRNSMTNGKTMQKLNEGYDSVEVVDGVVKSAILKGNTLVNVNNGFSSSWGGAIISKSEVSSIGRTVTQWTFDKSLLKSNTTYLLKFDCLATPTINRVHGFAFYADNGVTGYADFSNGPISIIATSGDLSISTNNLKLGIQLGGGEECDVTLSNIMLIEYQNGMENWDIPYFTGMQSVKMPVLTTTGKNLFDVSKGFYLDKTYDSETLQPTHYDGLISNDSIIVSDSVEYLTVTRKSGITTYLGLHCYDSGMNLNHVNYFYADERIVDIPNETKFVKVVIPYFNDVLTANSCNFMVEVGRESSTTYEPYKSNILSCNEEVTLRGIGDVKDTLDGNTGELTQRIGEVVLDGSENGWYVQGGNENCFVCRNFEIIKVKDYKTICDKFIEQKMDWNFPSEGIYYYNLGIYIAVKNEKLESLDINGFKKYINKLKPKICYKMEKPIVKTVDLSILDQDNQPVEQLNSFTNGYIQVSSQEGTLIPTTEYEVPTSNSYHVDLMKPNTQYTMKNMQGTFTIDGIQYNASANGTFTSPSTLGNRLVITNVVQTQPMLLEGDMTSKEVPYVEGIKSTFEGVYRVEIVSQNADNTLSNTTSFQLTNPLRSLPNRVQDEIVLDRVNHKAKIIQRVGEDLTQLDTPIVTEVNLEGYPYVYKGGHIFLNTEIAPTTEVTYSINQAHQIESSNEDILRHQKEINHLYELIAQYVQVQYEAELIDIALQG